MPDGAITILAIHVCLLKPKELWQSLLEEDGGRQGSLMQLKTPPEPVNPENAPERIQQLRALRQSVVLWLVIFGLLSLVLALYLISANVRDDIALSGTTLRSVQDTLIRLTTPPPEVQSLTATLTTTLDLADQLEAARPPAGVDWPAVMAFVSNYNPTEITLTSLTQADNRIILTGQAIHELAVVEYVNRLKQSNLFADVITQSVKRITPDTASTQGAPEEATPEITPQTVEFVIVLILSEQSS
jgi:hypothetical protein